MINSKKIKFRTRLRRFVSSNKWISIFLVVAVAIISSYIISYDCPELFVGANLWFNVLFQIAVGYVINFIFYVTQVYIPNIKRANICRELIYVKLYRILKPMYEILSYLSALYNPEHIGNQYSRDDLHKLLVLNFDDTVDVVDSLTLEPLTVKEYLKRRIIETKYQVDRLLYRYNTDISSELMDVLENIYDSEFHQIMGLLLPMNNNYDIHRLENIFVNYYDLICKLESIKEKEYNTANK